jgi:hypothetical protein
MEILGQAMGFQSYKEVSHYNQIFEKKLQQVVMDKMVKEAVRTLNDYARLNDDGLMSKNLHHKIQAISIAATGGDQLKAAEFTKRIYDKLGSDVGEVEARQWKEMWNADMTNISDFYAHEKEKASAGIVEQLEKE